MYPDLDQLIGLRGGEEMHAHHIAGPPRAACQRGEIKVGGVGRDHHIIARLRRNFFDN